MSISDTRIEHINYILDKVNKKRLENQNCDCTIKYGNETIEAHQIILQIASSVFRDLIETVQNETSSKHITIDINHIVKTPKYFASFINFLYTGKIVISNDNIFEILDLANLFLVESIVMFCCRTITDLLSVENIIQIYQIAKQSKQKLLLETCNSYLEFEFFNLENLFQQFSHEDFLIIINDNRLVLWNKETNYFLVAMNYVLELCRIIKKYICTHSTCQNDDVLSLTNEHSDCDILFGILENIQNSMQTFSIHSNDFFVTKNFLVPNVFTCPIDRYLPFGMHPLQYKSLPYKTCLCSKTVFNTIQDCSPNEWKIQEITFYIIPKWNNICQIIAGMDVTYQKIWNDIEIKNNNCQIDNYEKYLKKKLKLNSSENIVKIEINHSWIVNSLTFETDQGNVFGPFGEPNPSQCQVQTVKIDIRTHKSGLLYLHGFHYIDIMSCGFRLCNQLSFECANLNITKLQNQYNNISNLITRNIESKISKHCIENEQHHSNINILNTRPITLCDIENEIL